MKKHVRISAIITALVTLSSGAVSSFTGVAAGKAPTPPKGGMSLELPGFTGVIGGEKIGTESLLLTQNYLPISGKVSLYGDDEPLPESFDMRREGMTTSVKNQNPYGTCWTFSAAASAESSLLKYKPSVDLSELHTAFFTYFGESRLYYSGLSLMFDDSILDLGGNCYAVGNLWSQWNGAIDEEKLGYVDGRLFADEDYSVPNEEYAQQYEYLSDYHLKNAYIFDYSRDGSNREEVNELVKQFVFSGNIVDISYCTDGYSYNTGACYSEKSPMMANHSVSVVGWDDSYTAANFDGNVGAWLIKNSWGTHFSDEGYFWLSYADSSICEFSVFEMTGSESLSDIYFHDSTCPSQNLCADEDMDINKPSYAANVFTAERTEQLEAISTYISKPGTEYEITVYTGLSDPGDPASGTASAVTSGISELTGYITIDLDENVLLEENELFSVEVKYYCDDSKFVIPVEASTYLEDKESGAVEDTSLIFSNFASYEQLCNLTGHGESFYSEDGSEWFDVKDEDYQYSDEEKDMFLEALIDEMTELNGGTLSEKQESQIQVIRDKFEKSNLKIVLGNISVKAFANPVNAVEFSHDSGNVPLDEGVELSVKSGKDVYYSVNGGDYSKYEQPISITENMNISATTDFENYTERTYNPSYSEFISLDYAVKDSGSYSRDNLSAIRKDAHTYEINTAGSADTIKFYPISASTISLNGTTIPTGTYSDEFALEYGTNVFEFILIGENSLENKVMVTVNRSSTNFDLEAETVHIEGNHILTAPDGHQFTDGESVSDYAGQTLTVEIGSEIYEVKVPERAVLPELELDCLNETLNFISNDITEYTEISTDGGTSYHSAEGRFIDGQNITSGMVMNSALKVIPGELFMLRIAPGGGKFASASKEFVIPQAKDAPDEIPVYSYKDGKIELEISDVLEYGKVNPPLTESQLAETADKFGYTVEKYTELMMNRYGLSDRNELLTALAIEWDAVFSYDTAPVKIGVRYYSGENSFATKMTFQTIGKVRKGDINLDTVVDAKDASEVLNYYAQISTGGNPVLSEIKKYAADYDNDSVIDAKDASAILKYYADVATGAVTE